MRTKALLSGLIALVLSCFSLKAQSRMDTLHVSSNYTTHIIFNTDLIYADLSNSTEMAAKILDQSKNIIALKAKWPFLSPMSVSALESNGNMHTYILVYENEPGSLIYDMRDEPSRGIVQSGKKNPSGDTPGMYRKADAPLLKDVVAAKQSLWHISSRQYDIEVTCTNILSYSDITYMVFTLSNRSGVSYECTDATFVVESKKKSKKSVVYDRNLFPKSRFGTLSCAPGDKAAIGYSLDKISLARDQVLKVYFYEHGGQRELVLTIDSKDINKAKTKL